MKKVITIFAALFTMGAVMAQTIVSTEVEKRNVLIEEFTGTGCGFCPDGHDRANQICQQYAGHAWAINIHQGDYATGSGYETQWGDALANQYPDLEGYPCGVTNRCPNIQNRGEWAASAAQVRSEDSPVNIGAVATIDPTTRTLTVNVEAYYTGSTSASTNFLNVVLMQDSIIGPQSNYGINYQGYPYNADYVTADGQYIHMHMLRDMLTGQWGEEIQAVEHTLVERTYTYTLPTTIGAVDLNFSHLRVIVFITETHKNVLTANEAEITLLPGAYIAGFNVEHNECDLAFTPYVTVGNTFDADVTSWVLNYDGTELTFNKTVAPDQYDTIHMPTHTIAVSGEPVQHCATTKTVGLVSFVKDGMVTTVESDATASVSFADFDIYTAAGPFVARVGVDAWRSEAGVSFLNQSTCQTVWSENNFGADIPYSAQTVAQLPNGSYYDITFDPAQGLYILRLTDRYGDGWVYTNNSIPAGFWLTDAAGNSLISETWGYSNGIAFSNIDYYINVTSNGNGSESMGIDNAIEEASFSIYPNPATDRLNIVCGDAIREVNILDMSGRTVMTYGSNNNINISSLAAGVYVVRVVTENGIGVQKFVKE